MGCIACSQDIKGSSTQFKESKYFLVEYRNISNQKIELFIKAIDKYFLEIQQGIGFPIWEIDSKVLIIICENRADYFYKVISLGGSFENAAYSCGITFSDLATIVVYKNQGKLDDRIVIHEMVHIMLNLIFKDSPIPLWLNEGIALYFETLTGKEPDLSLSTDAILKYQKSIRNEFIDFSDLDTHYPKSHDDKLMMYFQSYSFVNFLIQKYGMNVFQKFLYKTPSYPVNIVVIDVFGANIFELQREWETAVLLKK